VKSKCLNREELIVGGWTIPEGSRPYLGALLLGYYTDDGQLLYAGRAGTGSNDKELKRLVGGCERDLGVGMGRFTATFRCFSASPAPTGLCSNSWICSPSGATGVIERRHFTSGSH
jgi:hypothetical protein